MSSEIRVSRPDHIPESGTTQCYRMLDISLSMFHKYIWNRSVQNWAYMFIVILLNEIHSVLFPFFLVILYWCSHTFYFIFRFVLFYFVFFLNFFPPTVTSVSYIFPEFILSSLPYCLNLGFISYGPDYWENHATGFYMCCPSSVMFLEPPKIT